MATLRQSSQDASGVPVGGETALTAPVRSPRRLRRRLNPELLIGGTLLVAILVLTVAAPLLTSHEPNSTTPGASLLPPDTTFLLGTDAIGRDVFTRVIYGGRVSLAVAFPAVGLALLLGLLFGLPAGYVGGRVDQAIMRVLDVFFAFPAILLALAIVAILGPSIHNLIITIGVIYMPRMARIVRAPTLAIKEQEFIDAARALGVAHHRIVLRHVLPNVSSPVIVEIGLALGQVILTETALSFLGLGPPPPDPSWGAMLSESRQFMEFASWTVLAPGIAIVLATASFLLLGHGLRVALDPRQQR